MNRGKNDYNKGVNLSRKNKNSNVYALSFELFKYAKKIVIKLRGYIDSNTIINGNFNILLSAMDKTYRKEDEKKTGVLSWIQQTATEHTYNLVPNNFNILIWKYILYINFFSKHKWIMLGINKKKNL